MTAGTNLDRLKSAYQAWHDSKGASGEPWLGLMAENVLMSSLASDQGPELDFAGERRGRGEAAGYFTGLLNDWSMNEWIAETFVGEGDRICMFGHCSWTHKGTGKTANLRIAHYWEFEDGEVIGFTEVFDSARVIAAATRG